jgi:DNA mismatch repair ATPase MutL
VVLEFLDALSRKFPFNFLQHGDSRAYIHTTGLGSRTDAIRSFYGPVVARELVEIAASDNEPSHSVFKMEGFISSENYSAKKTTMVLFINGENGLILVLGAILSIFSDLYIFWKLECINITLYYFVNMFRL